jgi:hypothetical protein
VATPLLVSLPFVEAINIIPIQWDLGFDIPNNVQAIVQLQKFQTSRG